MLNGGGQLTQRSRTISDLKRSDGEFNYRNWEQSNLQNEA